MQTQLSLSSYQNQHLRPRILGLSPIQSRSTLTSEAMHNSFFARGIYEYMDRPVVVIFDSTEGFKTITVKHDILDTSILRPK